MIILGILDIAAALILAVQAFSPLSLAAVAFVFSLYLIIKAIFFIMQYSFDVAGALDILSGVALFLSMFIVLPKAALIILAILLIIKGVQSIFFSS